MHEEPDGLYVQIDICSRMPECTLDSMFCPNNYMFLFLSFYFYFIFQSPPSSFFSSIIILLVPHSSLCIPSFLLAQHTTVRKTSKCVCFASHLPKNPNHREPMRCFIVCPAEERFFFFFVCFFMMKFEIHQPRVCSFT